jgi:hypothetical protein
MALEPRDLGAHERAFASSLRFHPEDNKPVKIGAIAGDPLLPVGTPLMEDAGTPGEYLPWATGNDIVAFLFPRAHQASSTGETLAVAMTSGDVHAADVPLPAGQLQANLDAALIASSMKDREFHVQGLEDVSL